MNTAQSPTGVETLKVPGSHADAVGANVNHDGGNPEKEFHQPMSRLAHPLGRARRSAAFFMSPG